MSDRVSVNLLSPKFEGITFHDLTMRIYSVTCPYDFTVTYCVSTLSMEPAAPLRKKFHSRGSISSLVFMISPHSMNEKTSLSFSNKPLHRRQSHTGTQQQQLKVYNSSLSFSNKPQQPYWYFKKSRGDQLKIVILQPL